MRINESRDDHDFYVETNRVAHELDTTRQTGGVRYITESELLEDVYTMNDFILGNEELGGNRPRTALRPQQETTGLDRTVPYMITEYRRAHVPDQELRPGAAAGRARAPPPRGARTPPMAIRRSPAPSAGAPSTTTPTRISAPATASATTA